MLAILQHTTFRRLFLAQVAALVGTGLATVALALLAYDIERLLSPMLAAVLLTMISLHGLLAGTSVGFVLSSLMVRGATFPR